MELLAQYITPILSLWVIHNAIFRSADFVNKMRETVISGFYEGREITPEHRAGILLDWYLCMVATIFVCVFFVVIVVVGGELLKDEALGWIPIAIVLYPGGCAAGFIICGRNDCRLMRDAVEAAAQEKRN